jgi:hypothetical protein
VDVGIDAAGDHQQALGVDLPGTGHGPAELRDPAAGDAHVGLLPVLWRHDHAVADNEVKVLLRHTGILARRRQRQRMPRLGQAEPVELTNSTDIRCTRSVVCDHHGFCDFP